MAWGFSGIIVNNCLREAAYRTDGKEKCQQGGLLTVDLYFALFDI
jgi:hypothetical protein